MAASGIDVTISGPLFEGDNVGRVLDRFAEDTRRELGDFALNEAQAVADRSIRRGTGFYRSKLEHDGEGVVGYGRVVYGAWLEGDSSRNQTSRFKGYRIFQKTQTRVRREAPAMAAEIMAKHIAELS